VTEHSDGTTEVSDGTTETDETVPTTEVNSDNTDEETTQTDSDDESGLPTGPIMGGVAIVAVVVGVVLGKRL
jgi:cobalamin biosynthesis Mg chelatase CobN